jgi:hypothetical protein
MKKRLPLIPIVILLTGCPAKDGLKMGKRSSIYIDGERVCFTLDKQKILTHYALKKNSPNDNFLLYGDAVQLSYPDSCFTASLKKGEVYNADYIVDGRNYYYTFIIDSESRILTLGR